MYMPKEITVKENAKRAATIRWARMSKDQKSKAMQRVWKAKTCFVGNDKMSYPKEF